MLVTAEPSSDKGFDYEVEEDPEECDGNVVLEEEEKEKNDDDRNDSSQEIEFEGRDEDVKPEKSKRVALEDNDDECNFIDPLDELQTTQGMEVLDKGDGVSKFQILDKGLVSITDNGFPSIVNNKGVRSQLEKEASIEAYFPRHDRENPSGNTTCLNNKLSSSNERILATNSPVRNGSGDKVCNVVLYSEEETIQSGENIILREPSLIIPQMRSRSRSPSVEFVNKNKRPTTLCNFFAKGWCIKGSLCRFLHKKGDVVNPSSMAKGDDDVVKSLEDELQEDPSLRQNAKKSRISSPEPLASSVAGYQSSSSHFSSDRILVEEHEDIRRWCKSSEEDMQLPLKGVEPSLLSSNYVGGENSRQNRSFDKYCNEASPCIQGDLHKKFSSSDDTGSIPWNSVVREENKRYSQTPLFYSNHNHHSNHMSGYQELVRGYSSTRNNIVVPDYRHFSSGTSTSSSIYGNHTSFAFGKHVVECSQNLKGHPSFFDGRASVGLNSSLNSSFENFNPSLGTTQLHRPFACPRVSPSQGSSPLGHQKLSDSGQGNYASRSASLHKTSSSPFYSSQELDNLLLNNIPVDPVAYIRRAIAYNWEPSIPFRPSFHLTLNFISSPKRQYNPLLDSIELPNVGDRSLQSSSLTQGVIIHKTSQKNGDYVGLDQQPQSVLSDKSLYSHGLAADTPTIETTRVFVADEQNKSFVPKDEKPLKVDPIVKVSNANEGFDQNLGPIDGIKRKKEPKVLKPFRALLVDFVKELVKPYWREGQLSKDAHNMVVRKAVEKVVDTLQPHQIPSTPQSTNQYLSSSRPKLTKLVEGYVSKYGKS